MLVEILELKITIGHTTVQQHINIMNHVSEASIYESQWGPYIGIYSQMGGLPRKSVSAYDKFYCNRQLCVAGTQ